MKVFEFDDYRRFIRSRVESAPKGGHGQYRRIAEHLDIPTSLVSQIMSGGRELSLESASLLTDYFGLSPLESDFFLNLVELERASHPSLKAKIQKRIGETRERALNLKQRIPHEKALTDKESQHFYSQWIYSGVRLMTSIEGMNSAEAIAASLRLPIPAVAQVLEFLIEAGLCVEKPGAKIAIGPRSTHIGNDSPQVLRHHANWRLKVLNQMSKPKDHELVFTGPVTLGKEARLEVKKLLLRTIDDWGKIADGSKEETLSCLNIDWVDIS
jgi:plasmid maintenance system antidote protein VapI